MGKFKTRAEYERWKAEKGLAKQSDDDQDTLAVHLKEQKLVLEVRAHLKNGKSFFEIAELFNARGLRTRSGDIWIPSSVKKLVETES